MIDREKPTTLKRLPSAFALATLLLTGCGGSDLPIKDPRNQGSTSEEANTGSDSGNTGSGTNNGSSTNSNTSGNNTSNNTNNNTNNSGIVNDGNITISAEDTRLVLTKQTESSAPPANVSVSFNVETNTGKPISDLTLDNFQLFENDTLISKFEAAPQIIPEENEFTYSTLLLLDFSASVVSTGLDELKLGAAEFVSNVLNSSNPSGTKEIAIAIFDGSADIRFISDFSSDASALLQQIEPLNEDSTLDSSTNLYGAVELGLQHLENRIDDNGIIDTDLIVAGSLVLFTDGRDQAARVTKETALRAVDNSGNNVAIFTIGLGEEIDLDTLQTIGKNGFNQAESLDTLVSTFTDIATSVDAEANSFYKLDYCSPKRGGDQHTLRVVVNYEGLTGSLNVSFSANQFTGGCQLL